MYGFWNIDPSGSLLLLEGWTEWIDSLNQGAGKKFHWDRMKQTFFEFAFLAHTHCTLKRSITLPHWDTERDFLLTQLGPFRAFIHNYWEPLPPSSARQKEHINNGQEDDGNVTTSSCPRKWTGSNELLIKRIYLF